jgi:hypothetical protein
MRLILAFAALAASTAWAAAADITVPRTYDLPERYAPVQATPKKDWACLISGSVSPWLIFDNTGHRHSKAAVSEFYGECSYQGFYAAGYRAQSLNSSPMGNETDAMFGYRGSLGFLDYDARAHYYHFNVDGRNSLDQYGGRLTVSHTFEMPYDWKLKPFVTFDGGYITSINKDIYGGAVGVAASRKMKELWLTPTLEMSAKTWHYLETPAPGKGTPIHSVSAKLDFDVTQSCKAGPAVLFTQNDILGPQRHRGDFGYKIGSACSF